MAKEPHFLWITEFPLFTHADEDKEFLAQGRWSATHHPFTAPMWEDMENLKAGKEDMVNQEHASSRTGLGSFFSSLLQVRGQHYDLVLNGVEIGGGSVRIHDAKLQKYILEEVLEVCTRIKSVPAMHADSLPLKCSLNLRRFSDSTTCFRL
jgi:aspartyl-tRNA synthetase